MHHGEAPQFNLLHFLTVLLSNGLWTAHHLDWLAQCPRLQCASAREPACMLYGVLSPGPFSCELSLGTICAAPCELAFCAAPTAHRLGHRDQCSIGNNWSPGAMENPTAVTERKGQYHRKTQPSYTSTSPRAMQISFRISVCKPHTDMPSEVSDGRAVNLQSSEAQPTAKLC